MKTNWKYPLISIDEEFKEALRFPVIIITGSTFGNEYIKVHFLNNRTVAFQLENNTSLNMLKRIVSGQSRSLKNTIGSLYNN